MKTLLATAALIVVSTFAIAANKPEKVNLATADLAIDHYVAVTTIGESTGLEELFSTDFSQMVQTNKVTTNSRSEVISFLKKQKGEQLNCKTSTLVIEETEDYMIAKVTLEFEGFTKSDLVTLIHDGDSWKVSQSINSYK